MKERRKEREQDRRRIIEIPKKLIRKEGEKDGRRMKEIDTRKERNE